jgi:gliding motility-associated-like protein
MKQRSIKFIFVSLVIAAFFLITNNAQAQCNCTGCTISINTASSANITANAGDVICLGPNAVITGTITVNQGGQVCNAGTVYGDILLNYMGNFCNDGKIDVTNLFVGVHSHFTNYGTVIVENFVQPGKSGQIMSYGCIHFKKGFSTPIGADTHFDGVTFIDGDLTVGGAVNLVVGKYLEVKGKIIVKDAGTLQINGGVCVKASTVELQGNGKINGAGPGYGQIVVSGPATNTGSGSYTGQLDVCLSSSPGTKPAAATINPSVTFCTNNMNCAAQFCENDSTCKTPPTAGIPTMFVNCQTRTVTFTNTSTGTTKFLWNFGDTTTLADTSQLANPTYTYPAYGTYGVTLVAYAGSSKCNDTLANFPVTIDSCTACPMTLSTTKVDATCGIVAGGCNAIPITLSDWTSEKVPASDPCGGTGIFAYFNNSTDVIGTSPSKTYYICGATTVAVTPSEWSQNKLLTTASPCPAQTGSFIDQQTGPFLYMCPCTSVGTGDGRATVIPTAGNPPFTYLWSPSGGTGATESYIGAGIYTVDVTDASGCQKSTTVIIDANSNITLAASQTPLSVCGATDGTATVIPSGGKGGTYTYSWSTTPAQTGATATGLSAGTVTVIVTDSAGCTKSNVFTFTGPASVSVLTAKTDIKCKGATTGTVTAFHPTTGVGPYTYKWNTNPAVTDTFMTNLKAGYYIVTVTDANGCIGTAAATVADSSLTVSLTSTNVRCSGGTDGTATITAVHGTPAYTYSWNSSPVQITATATGLPHGTYIGKVTDAAGCADSVTVTINQPFPFTSQANNTSTMTCSGVPTGSADVVAIGGTGQFTYSWCNGSTAATATGLPEGKCIVTITDSLGCANSDTVTIAYPLPFVATKIDASVSCNGDNNGTASINITGGSPVYTFLWNTTPVQTTQSAINLGVGTYSVIVTDSKGCTSTTSVSISEPTALNLVKGGTTNAGCNLSNGKSTVIASGGTLNYSYLWNTTPPQTDSVATGMAPGTYIALVTDAHGCSDTVNITITGAISTAKADFKVDYALSCDNGIDATFTNTGSGATGWLWKFEDGTTSTLKDPPVHKFGFSQTSPVTLIAIDGGCADTLKMDIATKALDDYLRIPNVFTPNGDGKNECFEVSALNYMIPCIKLTIYDRWGLLMYDNEHGACWDGKYNGKDVPEGTYYYLIKMGTTGKEAHGALSLLR